MRRRLPGAEDLLPPGGPVAGRPGRRLRRRARQPGARHGHPRHRAAGTAADHHDPPSDHLRPPHRPGRRHQLASQARRTSLVRLRPDAGAGRPAGPQGPHPVRGVPSRHRPRLRGRSGPDAGHPPRRRRRLRPADPAAGPGAHPRDGQRRRPDEGHRHPARGLRQAAHRARRRAGAGEQAATRWPHRADDRPARHQRLGAVRPRGQRRGAGGADGVGRGGLRPLALRRLQPADRGADGLRHPAGGLPRRRHPRGRGGRRRLRRPGHAG